MSNSDLLKDEVYENMDDISKLIEPFEYTVNNELSLFPDEIELDAKYFSKLLSYNSWGEYWSEAINYTLKRKANELNLLAIEKELSQGNFVYAMFEVAFEPDITDGEVTYDAANDLVLGGRVVIRKKKIAVEDKEIESSLAVTINSIFNKFVTASEVNKKRLNEIAELFGATEARKERAWRKKIKYLNMHFQQLVDQKKLVIKDIELFCRFLEWNFLYIKNGSLPAIANITRIKIMMRNGVPIYSIKEEQV